MEHRPSTRTVAGPGLLGQVERLFGSRLLVRRDFGLEWCMIPVACLPELDDTLFVFTLAGPCYGEGRKDFYFLIYDPSLEATQILRHVPDFSSVSDFHLNCAREKWTTITPVAGEKAVEAELVKCSFRKLTRRTQIGVALQ